MKWYYVCGLFRYVISFLLSSKIFSQKQYSQTTILLPWRHQQSIHFLFFVYYCKSDIIVFEVFFQGHIQTYLKGVLPSMIIVLFKEHKGLKHTSCLCLFQYISGKRPWKYIANCDYFWISNFCATCKSWWLWPSSWLLW